MKKSILKAEEPDIDKLVLMACAEWGISERTAKEYLKIAQAQIEIEKAEAPKIIEDAK